MHQTQGHPSTLIRTLMALRTQTDTNTVIVGDLNTLLSPIDRSSRQKINKETRELLHTLGQIDMVMISTVCHPTTRQYTYFSAGKEWNFLQNRSYFRTQSKSQQIQEIKITL
jgi:exonuclease III